MNQNLIYTILGIFSFIACVWMIWLTKIMTNLKSAISSQKEIIDSLKSHTEYVKNIQDTVSNLYDPNEIKNIVDCKVQIVEKKYINEINDLEKKLTNRSKNTKEFIKYVLSIETTISKFIVQSICYMSEENVNHIFNNIKDSEGKQFIESILNTAKNDVMEIRKEIKKIAISDIMMNQSQIRKD